MKPSEALAAHRDELRSLISRYSVAHPRVYGSVLTGKDDEESDLDLLVDATERTTLFTLAGLEHEAQRLLGVQVSVLTSKDLPMKFRNEVLRDIPNASRIICSISRKQLSGSPAMGQPALQERGNVTRALCHGDNLHCWADWAIND
jgi:uncharacterized protein